MPVPMRKNLKTSSRYPWDRVSKALAMSTATTAPLMLLLLQCRIVSSTFIRHSCVNLESLKPFWARLQIRLTTVESRLFIALEIILYMLESRLIGLQFFSTDRSPFFGMSLMLAFKKLAVRLPF